jgi:hypothetical protein
MTEPTVPTPDDKDWTWTITEPCPDCGFDARAVARSHVPELVRRYVADLHSALDRDDAAARPEPGTWSPLEYACHVRDVCRIFDRRVRLMLTADDPQFENWDQDATALEQRYWAQDPAAVSDELGAAADTIADTFGTVDGEQWQRPGRRSNGSVFTVDTIARYFLHDVAHHAWDVDRLVDEIPHPL